MGALYARVGGVWVPIAGSGLPVYSSVAARTAGNPAPRSGDPSYLDTGNETEGLEFFNGTSWRKEWNMPWGPVANPLVIGVNSTNFSGTFLDIPGFTMTFPVIAGRFYEVTWMLESIQNSVVGTQAFQISLDAGGTSLIGNEGVAAGALRVWSGMYHFIGATSVPVGSRTIKLQGRTSAGTMDILNGSAMNGRYAIKDIGPAVGVAPA